MKTITLIAAAAVALASTGLSAATWVQYDIYGQGDDWAYDAFTYPTVWTHSRAALHATFYIEIDPDGYGNGAPPVDPWGPIQESYYASAQSNTLSFGYSLIEDDCGHGYCENWQISLQFAPGSFDSFPSQLPALVNGSFNYDRTGHWFGADAQGTVTIAKAKIVAAPGQWSFQVTDVPEPGSWAMMLVGFGLLGGVMRHRKVAVRFG